MKKILYGTTALAALGLIAGGAHAADKMGGPIQVSIGGYFYGFLQGVSQENSAGDAGNHRKDFAITDKSRIQFDGSTTLDNGLQAGFRVQLRGNSAPTEIPNQNSADQIDDHYLFLSSASYGRVELGTTASAARKMFYGPSTPLQPAAGLNSPNFQWMANGNPLTQPTTLIDFGITDKAQKITYFTPRIAGFQLGVSYAPDNCTQNENIGLGNGNTSSPASVGNTASGTCIFYGPTPFSNDIGQQKNLIEGGANYAGKFGTVDFGAYLAAGHSNLEAQPLASFGTLKDKQQYAGGFRVGVAGFTIGSSVRYDNLGTTRSGSATPLPTQRWDANIGVAYHTGPWGIGATYAYAQDKQKSATADLGKDKLNAQAIGVSYTLGPGILLVGGVEHLKFDAYNDDPAHENKGFLYTAGTVLNF